MELVKLSLGCVKEEKISYPSVAAFCTRRDRTFKFSIIYEKYNIFYYIVAGMFEISASSNSNCASHSRQKLFHITTTTFWQVAGGPTIQLTMNSKVFDKNLNNICSSIIEYVCLQYVVHLYIHRMSTKENRRPSILVV